MGGWFCCSGVGGWCGGGCVFVFVGIECGRGGQVQEEFVGYC